MKIPVCRPYFTGKEIPYVTEAIQSGWISSAGSYLSRFEKEFPKFCGVDYAVSCTNGTAAVHMALYAAGVTKGDRVIVPSFTMMASVFPILQLGATPVFVDADEKTWTLDTNSLQKVEGPVKAILTVHIYGHPCDMDAIYEFAKIKNAIVIEDAAEAHGALYKNKPIGSLSTVAAFSFYANKIITSGEGGAVVSNNLEMVDRARYLHNLCFDKNPELRYIHRDVGYNFRWTNVQAAIACAQLEEAEKLVELRRAMAMKYLQRLKDLPQIQLPVEMPWAKNVYWMFGILLDSKFSVEEIRRKLIEKGIDTRRFFYPGHLQPAVKEQYESLPCPVSERLWNKGLYLPSSSDLTDLEADYVAENLRQILRG